MRKLLFILSLLVLAVLAILAVTLIPPDLLIPFAIALVTSVVTAFATHQVMK